MNREMTQADMERIGRLSAKLTETVITDRSARHMGDILVALGMTAKCLLMLQNECEALDADDKKIILKQVLLGLDAPIGLTELPEDATENVRMSVHRKH